MDFANIVDYFNKMKTFKPSNTESVMEVMRLVLSKEQLNYFNTYCNLIINNNGDFEIQHLEDSRSSLYEDSSEFIY